MFFLSPSASFSTDTWLHKLPESVRSLSGVCRLPPPGRVGVSAPPTGGNKQQEAGTQQEWVGASTLASGAEPLPVRGLSSPTSAPSHPPLSPAPTKNLFVYPVVRPGFTWPGPAARRAPGTRAVAAGNR